MFHTENDFALYRVWNLATGFAICKMLHNDIAITVSYASLRRQFGGLRMEFVVAILVRTLWAQYGDKIAFGCDLVWKTLTRNFQNKLYILQTYVRIFWVNVFIRCIVLCKNDKNSIGDLVRVVFDRYAYIEIRTRIRSNAYSHSRGPQSKTLLQLSARVIKDFKFP